MANIQSPNAVGTRQEKLNRFFVAYCNNMDESGKVSASISRLCNEAVVSRAFFYAFIGNTDKAPDVAYEVVREQAETYLASIDDDGCISVLRALLDAAIEARYAAGVVLRCPTARAKYREYLSAVLEERVFVRDPDATEEENNDIFMMNKLYFFFCLGNIVEDALYKGALFSTESEAKRILAVMRGIRSAKASAQLTNKAVSK